MTRQSNRISLYSRVGVLGCALVGGLIVTGCAEPTITGACCGVDATCTVTTETECTDGGGTYQGDNTDCDTNSICEDEITVFRYSGGDCPPEMTIKDGDPGNVECGVPRSRLFDEDSPLDGTLADVGTGGFGVYPGIDGPADTGMLLRLDGFAVDSNGPRANIIVICLNIIIPPQAGMRRAVKCRIERAAGFNLTPEAQAIVDGGKRNYWAQQARRLAKLEADAAGGVDPGAARRADRLRRRFQRKNNTDYDVLADGTRYMCAMVEETEKIEIIPPTPGGILTIYLVFVGDEFSNLGEFITDLEIILAREPDADSPMLGDTDEYALVFESVDEVGPATVIDFANGAFDREQIDLTAMEHANAENAIWITNSGPDDIMLSVPGHPDTHLPADQQIAFNDLFDGQITAVNGMTDTVDVITGTQVVACCIEGTCDDAFTSEAECTQAGGTAFAGQSCSDDLCAPAADPWEAALGTYAMNGNCPGNGQNVMLSRIDDQLLLQGLPENDDIPLICEGPIALGSDVTAFDVEGHDLTLTIQDTGINLQLLQPDTNGACGSVLQLAP